MGELFHKQTTAIVLFVLLLAGLGIGCGSSGASEDPAETAMRKYRAELETEASTLVGWIARLAVEAEAGRIPQSQSRYASARVPFGHLAPLVVAYPSLAINLDAIPGEVQGRPLTGFHKLERQLWTEKLTKGYRKTIRQLFLDTRKLLEMAETTKFTPEEIARHINEIMATEVTREFLGDEELYARIDLLDLSAHVEGVEAAFDAIKPVLLEAWPGLVKQIESRFEEVYVSIEPFGIPAREPEQPRSQAPGVSFTVYDEVSRSELGQLQWRIDNLDKVLAEVPGAIAQVEAEAK